jgi:hypothetical protein
MSQNNLSALYEQWVNSQKLNIEEYSAWIDVLGGLEKAMIAKLRLDFRDRMVTSIKNKLIIAHARDRVYQASFYNLLNKDETRFYIELMGDQDMRKRRRKDLEILILRFAKDLKKIDYWGVDEDKLHYVFMYGDYVDRITALKSIEAKIYGYEGKKSGKILFTDSPPKY